MLALLSFAILLLRCVQAFFRSRSEQAIVELALRQRLAACARARRRPRLRALDRAFWVALRIPQQVRELIRRLALESGWGARKIQGELEKLGFSVGLATVSRYLPKNAPDGDRQQRWMTFLRNHRDGIAAMDFFAVPTVRFQLLYVWFVIDHGRRRRGSRRDQELWHRTRAHCLPQPLAESDRGALGWNLVGGLHHRYVWAEVA